MNSARWRFDCAQGPHLTKLRWKQALVTSKGVKNSVPPSLVQRTVGQTGIG
jgi:hypothetical protein